MSAWAFVLLPPLGECQTPMLGSDQTKGKNMLKMKSDGNTFVLTGLPFNETIEWVKGTHTAHCVNGAGRIVDVFTFSWEKNKTTMLDFTQAAQNFIEYYFEEKEYANAN
jgi:hypothetical protein